MFVPSVSKVKFNQTCLPCHVTVHLRTSVSSYLSVAPADQLRMQLGVRSYFKWYYTQPEIGALANKIRSAWNLHLK